MHSNMAISSTFQPPANVSRKTRTYIPPLVHIVSPATKKAAQSMATHRIFFVARDPRNEKTTNPAKKLVIQFPKATIIVSLYTLLWNLLYEERLIRPP
ncbi:hypothetical protein EB796_008881 [Bugula neritina]|uniref:Uncharacterized protein n=1 Tax=Bugula neritina TaxID=10212 RepID=A0A7J7K5H4_BUGNE|nr:hypothetical protein EB796_008881 [Bugula neritina]